MLNSDSRSDETNDSIDAAITEKLKTNLQSCMLFVAFTYICQDIDSNTDKGSKEKFANKFFANWKKFATESFIKNDLEVINSILNSPRNSFYFILKNSSEETESTELYQEKYNHILKDIEKFYFNSINNSKDTDD